jgi:hypothetical protein
MQLRRSILKVLAYFDLFDYPLSQEDILFFLDRPAGITDLAATLDALQEERSLFRVGAFYSLRDDPGLAKRRLKGNLHAQRLLSIAAKGSRLLFRFPYVRGIGISGSLSKNFADENADIDYFIITSANRLWIARTLMHLFKKLNFLIGRQDWYCMNYFVDEEALKIEEKNIFTATELVTLMPVCGNGVLEKFFDANEWANAYFPSYGSKKETMQVSHPNSWFKTVVERLLDNRIGEKLDNFLMELTTRRWKKKTDVGARNKKGDRMSLLTDKHYSRPDPAFLQARIMNFFNDRMRALETKWPDYFAADEPTRNPLFSSALSKN